MVSLIMFDPFDYSFTVIKSAYCKTQSLGQKFTDLVISFESCLFPFLLFSINRDEKQEVKQKASTECSYLAIIASRVWSVRITCGVLFVFSKILVLYDAFSQEKN